MPYQPNYKLEVVLLYMVKEDFLRPVGFLMQYLARPLGQISVPAEEWYHD